MREKDYDRGNELRRILAGLVQHPVVAARISSKWQPPGLFAADWANMVGTWAVDHLRRYGHPPGKAIAQIFETWGHDENQPEEIIDAVERFLTFVSDAGEDGVNGSPEHLLDVAGRHFNHVRLSRVISEAEAELSQGDDRAAHGILTGVARVELGEGSVVKPADEFEIWDQSFNQERLKPLVRYPGVLGKFIGTSLQRDKLFAIQASDKVGKSWYLLDLAVRAVRNRKRVAYFEVGDLGQDETVLRMGQRAAGRPLRNRKCRVPVSVDPETKVFVYEDKKFERLEGHEAFQAFRRLGRGGSDRLRLSCHPNSTISVAGIESEIADWEREDWRPDVIVIDYADILAPPEGVRDRLDQVDLTWKALRRLSQRTHTLVVTATQAAATAYTSRATTQGRQHFSGRKTKNAEVDGIIGLNQTADEKKEGVWRLNWVVRRSEAYTDTGFVRVAGCLAIGCPVLVSTR